MIYATKKVLLKLLLLSAIPFWLVLSVDAFAALQGFQVDEENKNTKNAEGTSGRSLLATFVTSQSEFNSAVADSATIEFSNDLTFSSTLTIASIVDLTVNGNGYKVYGQNAYQCLTISGATTTVTFNDIWFYYCRTGSSGGAVYSAEAETVIFNSCIFSSNYASATGGAVYFGSVERLEINDCELYSNSVGYHGGAVACLYSNTLSMKNSILYSNYAYYRAGALYVAIVDTVELIDVEMYSNTCNGQTGGAILFDRNGVMNITRSSFHDNTCNDVTSGYTFCQGGALCAFSGNFSCVDCTFRDNYATLGGGAYFEDIETTLIGTNVSTNYAVDMGGGLYFYHSADQHTVNKIADSVISGNSADDYAGGLFIGLGHSVSTLDIENTKIVGNSATYYGGGVYINKGSIAMTEVVIEDNVLESGKFTVNSGTGCTSKGGCFYSPNYPGLYGASESCSITGSMSGELDVINYAIFEHGDYMYVGATQYIFLNNPDEVDITSSDTISFTSLSSSAGESGFEICYLKGAVGGGVYVKDGEVAISTSTFSNNSVTRYGGGLFISAGDVSLSGVEFGANSAELSEGVEIYLSGGSLSSTDLRIIDYDSTSLEASVTCDSSCESGQYGNCTLLSSSSNCYVNCECHNCSAGRFSAYDGSTTVSDCEACATGYYSGEGASACTSCPVGYYATDNVSDTGGGLIRQVASLASRCNPCPAGYFAPSTASITCQACASGKSSTVGSSFCTDCEVGYYSTGGDAACTPCPKGQVAAQTGSSTCTSCAAGFYAANTSLSNCSSCPLGKYLGSTGQSQCFDCEAGKFTDEIESTSCTACPAGSVAANTGSENCTLCSIGYYQSATAQDNCDECAVGRVSSTTGQTTCDSCDSGKFASSIASSVCTNCEKGKYSLSGASQCIACAKGFVAAEEGASACVACSAGFYAANTSLSNCTSCPLGKFQGSTGQSECTSCEEGKYADEPGLGVCNDCPGNYHSARGALVCDQCLKSYFYSDDGSCEKCPEGTSCNQDGNSTLRTLSLNKGYWRLSVKSSLVYPCPVSVGCGGGSNGTKTDAYCQEGYEGPLCALCKENYYFNVDDQSCEQCSSPGTMVLSPTLLAFITVSAMLLVLGLMLYFGGARLISNLINGKDGAIKKLNKLIAREKHRYGGDDACITEINSDGSTSFKSAKVEEETVKNTTFKYTAVASITTTEVVEMNSKKKISVIVKPKGGVKLYQRKFQNQFKAATSFLQVCVNIGFNCGITFGGNFEKALQMFSWTNLDIFPSLGLQCYWKRFDYIEKMVLITIIPLLLLLSIAMLYFALRFHFSKDYNLRKVFKAYDEDNSNSISRAELEKALQSYLDITDDKVVHDIMDQVDEDGDGDITFEEFKATFSKNMSQKSLTRHSSFARLNAKIEAELDPFSHKLFNLFLLITFLVLISTSTTVFHYLKCRDFPDPDGGKESYLYLDYSIDCNSDRYKEYVPFAILMIMVYPIGIPSLYFVLLWGKREWLRDVNIVNEEQADGFPQTGHLQFLVSSYQPEYYYFEVLECVRRLLLASVIGIVASDSAASSVLGIIISQFFLAMFLKMKPFKDPNDSALATVFSYSLTLFFLAALMIKVDISPDGSADQKVFNNMLLAVLCGGPFAIFIQVTKEYFILVWSFVMCVVVVNGSKHDEESEKSKNQPKKSSKKLSDDNNVDLLDCTVVEENGDSDDDTINSTKRKPAGKILKENKAQGGEENKEEMEARGGDRLTVVVHNTTAARVPTKAITSSNPSSPGGSSVGSRSRLDPSIEPGSGCII